MNIYSAKQTWKYSLLIVAVVIGITSLWYTNQLTEKLSHEERKKVELWAEATRQLANAESSTDLSFILKVIIDNETVPVILADADDNVISQVNLDSSKVGEEGYLEEQLAIMKSEHEPIEVAIGEDYFQYIHYKNSYLLTQLKYFPYVQLGVISLFIVISYLAFSWSRKAEQNQVWMGLAKETAHQLGTPLSSIMAWLEVLRSKSVDEDTLKEFEKDVKRLETITDRFSKIGSIPKLEAQNLQEILSEAIHYMQSRVSKKVDFSNNLDDFPNLNIPLNISLFEWVVENILKNAVDAMNGAGTIAIKVSDQTQFVYIDIIDSGKGMTKSMYKQIFQPGFTTKKRGWGLGLSLCKRIIENYHGGKIFVKGSEVGKGTTFRIVLKK
ncbi:MAG TPA: HAMP domain-containing histidine kinase [Flavobacteriales bacterium]|nr:HAMP domain-containing histidine kinase [Flavobacteriales bacterium]